MSDPLDAVNAIAATYRNLASKNEAPPNNVRLWLERADEFDAVVEELTRLRSWAKPVPASYGDLSDLPIELISQLSGIKTDPLEDQIHAVVKAAGDEIELDRLLIELYRRFGDVHQRRFLNNKCYRMAQKGLIHLIRGRKGVYSIHPQADTALPTNDQEETLDTFENLNAPSPSEAFSADLEDEIPF